MKKSILFFSVILCVVGVNVYAQSSLKDKLNALFGQEHNQEKIVVDDALRKETHDFLIHNENVSIKDFRKFDLAFFASMAIQKDVNKRYGSTAKDYQIKVTDEKDKNIYRIALKIIKKHYYKAYYICKGNDENKVIESWKKVRSIRSELSAKIRQDPKFVNTAEAIRLQEQILAECRFEGAESSLLTAYRGGNDREKYNALMLRMIADDQVDYDYMYSGIDSINTTFTIHYLEFLSSVNRRQDKLVLTKDQVQLIAESVLTKNQEIFNFKNEYYSKPYNEFHVSDAVQSLVNLSTWLRTYGLDPLNEKLLDRFFHEDIVIITLQQNRDYKDFLDYLLQRKDFEQYRDGQ